MCTKQVPNLIKALLLSSKYRDCGVSQCHTKVTENKRYIPMKIYLNDKTEKELLDCPFLLKYMCGQ